MKALYTALFLGFGSLLLFALGLRNPADTIFDESVYVDPARALLAHAPDPSLYKPPLGKVLITLSMKLFGDTPFGWRMPSVLLGAATVVAVFLLLNLLLDDYTLALTGALIALFNNFVYVFARTAMMDIFLVAFGIWGILGFVAAVKLDALGAAKRRAALAFSGLMLGFACACKWNGVDELSVVVLLAAILLVLARRSKNPEIARYGGNLREAGVVWSAMCLFLLPVLAYSLTFWPLCWNQGLPFTPTGLISLHKYMWHFHRTIMGNPGLLVPWFRWPFQTQPTRSLSYLVGNWYVMWVGLLALLYCLRRFARNLPETFVISLYAVNMLQWAVTPQPCQFYYYYFPSAMFLGMAIPVALHRLPERYHGVRLSVVSVLPAFCVFAYCFAHMAHLGAPYDSMLGYWP